MRGLGPRASGLGFAAAIAVFAIVATAHADGPRATAVGFDHWLHDRQLVVNGGDSLACARCHVTSKGKLVGKPDHTTCFGACHGSAPVRPRAGTKLTLDPDRLKLCTACHAEAALTAPFSGRLAVHYPPYTIDRDFNLAIGHKQHAQSPCTECHAPPETRAKPPEPHARCIACHDGTRAPAMERCAGCHPQASGKPQPPELAALNDTVTTAFSHAKHAGRSAHGRECATCHAAIRNTDDTELPRPTVRDCAAGDCHDGKAAFGTTVACTRCHTGEPPKFKVARPTTRFTHAGPHAAAVHDTACGGCHPITGGEVVVASHHACDGCHADDFGSRQPKICGACHNGTEPWRTLVPDRVPAETSELGVSLDHRKHLDAQHISAASPSAACTGCHSLRTTGTELRPPRGHGACTGAGCHRVTGGPAPQLGECIGCHRLGLATERTRERLAAPWSVRAAFQHAPHRRDRDGKEVACTACHVDLAAKEVLALATPAKATCAPCHDGTVAFKLTGTTCSRCHAKATP
jgi:c(7)-type cytochrome triheme protein